MDGLLKGGLVGTSGLVEESEANLKFISRGRYLERRGITIGRRGAVNERLREPHASGSCSGEGDWWWWLRLLVTLKAWRSVRRASLMVCLELFATSDSHLTFNITHALFHLHTSRPIGRLIPRNHNIHNTHMMIGQATGMLGEGEIASEE